MKPTDQFEVLDERPNGASAPSTDTEVLVVGGGPTGTMLAYGLTSRGISCRVLDKAPERFHWSRALVMHARTLEIADLAGQGMADEFLCRGYTVRGLNMAANDTEAALVDMSSLDTHFPFVLLIPQRKTEEVLESRLLENGGVVEWGTELLDLDDSGDVVEALIQRPDGKTETITSKYVVGCDGSHSKVRELAGIPFEGAPYQWINFLADAKVDGDVPRGGVRQYYSDRGLVFLASFGDDYYRIVAIDYTKQNIPTTEELELSDLQETVDAVLPTKWVLSEPHRIGRFRSSHRQVPQYRHGRTFLAGDAAHLHAPAGGQGLNAGVQDAFNLAWKLAMVLRREAPATLLESYNAERHQADARVLALSDLIFRSALIESSALKAVRELLAKLLVRLSPIRRLLAANLSGLGIDYRGALKQMDVPVTSRLQRVLKSGSSDLSPGCRVPDLELLDENRTRERLYNLIRGSGYKLFVYAKMNALSDDEQNVYDLMRRVKDQYGNRVQSFIILDEGVPEAVRGEQRTLVDFKQEASSKLGIRHGSVLLLRPDGFLLSIGKLSDSYSLLESLSGWATSDPSKTKADSLHKEHNEKIEAP